MTLKMESRLTRNNVAVSIFRSSTDGRRMVSFDKLFTSRRILGPLFTEREVCALLDILTEDAQSEIDLSQTTQRHITQKLAESTQNALMEIRRAIDELRRPPKELESGHLSEPKITVVNPMPQFTYTYTCRKCGCHLVSHLRVGMTTLQLCPNCEYVHARTR